MKRFWEKNKGTILILVIIVSLAAATIHWLAEKGNTPEDRQLHIFGGVEHQAPVTELMEMVQRHPDDVISVHRFVAKGASFAERIAVEGRNKSVWSISTSADDQLLLKTITELNNELRSQGKAQISLRNEPLQGEEGEVDRMSQHTSWGPTLVGVGLPLLLAFFMYRMFQKSLGGGGASSLFGSKKSPAKIFADIPGDTITLDDVQGIDEIKEDLKEWIEDIKAWNEAKTSGEISFGSRPDKARLFKGKPGTGKTMAARAIASECGLPALIMNGADFVRVFVGKGSENFENAIAEARVERDKSPYKSVMFIIDEVDALTKTRGGSMNGNDEADRTLTTVLAQMDGISDVEGFYFIGMTNQPEKMDPAALRPGRFHPAIEFPVPDEHGRKEILSVYAAKTKLEPDVDLAKIAKELPHGTTGSDIKNLFSSASKISRRSARKNRTVATAITLDAMLKAVDIQRFGAPISEARSTRIPESTKTVIFKHETGHLITGLVLHEISKSFGLNWGHEVKVISGMGPAGTGGYVMTDMGENMSLLSETELRSMMVLGFGGTTAESLFNRVKTVGNQNDIQQINRAADEMVTKFNMSPSDEVPAVFVPRRGGSQYLGGGEMPHYDGLGSKSMEQIDEAKGMLLRDAEAKARAILLHYQDFFHNFWPLLYERPGYRMYTDEIYQIWQDKTAHMPKPEWLTDYELWSAYWDVRSKVAPTKADLKELKDQEASRKYKALAGLGHAVKA